MMSDRKETNLIWIDLEMTGLNVTHDHIIEIATLVTDFNLNLIAEGPVIAIHQSHSILAAMDEWNTKQHKKSGLVDRVKQSSFSEQDAERITLDFLKQHILSNKSPMCGNSICQDRRFLYRCMPQLEAFFHYRNLDVSTIKELASRWYPDITKNFKKDSKHIALSDIYDSIEELKFYRTTIFKSDASPLRRLS